MNNQKNNIDNIHVPVLLKEVMSFLPQKKEINVVDATFGGGGYTNSILEKPNLSKIISIDCDPQALIIGKKLKNNKFILIEGKFGEIDKIISSSMKKNNLKGFDAIIFDLGLSTNQLNDNSRGFSFNKNGPLDMRMNNKGFSAFNLINDYNEKDIADIIFKYGEEKFAKRIARKIVEHRKNKIIETTFELALIVKKSIKFKHKYSKKINPATKTFQAIRIFVNNELDEIKEALAKSEKLLLPGGRIIIVSFHSLEDRIVKEYFNHKSGKKWRSSRHYPEPTEIGPITLKIITKKAIRPSEKEISLNPSSRSARLRVAEKVNPNKLN